MRQVLELTRERVVVSTYASDGCSDNRRVEDTGELCAVVTSERQVSVVVVDLVDGDALSIDRLIELDALVGEVVRRFEVRGVDGNLHLTVAAVENHLSLLTTDGAHGSIESEAVAHADDLVHVVGSRLVETAEVHRVHRALAMHLHGIVTNAVDDELEVALITVVLIAGRSGEEVNHRVVSIE